MVGTAAAERLPSRRQLKMLLKEYSKALREQPGNLDLRVKLAEVLRMLERAEEAIALYSSVAWAHGIAGNLGQAVNLCKIILQLNPEHSDTQQMLAKLYASQRIRQAKQSVPVVKIDGRWVADPRADSPPPSSAGADRGSAVVLRSPPANETSSPTMTDEPPVNLPVAHRVKGPGTEPAYGEEPTKHETPSSPDLVARRAEEPLEDPHRRPTSKELPAARRRAAQQQDDAVTSSGKIRSPEAVADTLLRSDRRVLLTADEAAEHGPPPARDTTGNVEEPTLLDSPGGGAAGGATTPAAGAEDDVRPTLERDRVGAESVPEALDMATRADPPTAGAVPAGRRLATEELSAKPSQPAEADAPARRLSPTDMMEQAYKSMPAAHSGQFRREEVWPADPQEQSDPLRFIRTTRRHAIVEDGEVDGEVVDGQIDPGLVSAVVRMEESLSGQKAADTKGYPAIQKEVREAGNEQADVEPNATDEEEVERSLLDTIRELPRETGPLGQISLPKVPYPLFSDLDTPAFLAMVEKLERRVCPAKTLLFQEGDPGDSLFLVSSGSLQVLKADDKGRLIELARLGPGSFFGEFGLLTDRHRHASVRAVDECELLELRRDVLLELIKEHPSISWTLRVFYQQRLMAMVLATSPLFQAVSPADRREVLSRFMIKRIMEGELIIQEGKPGTGFYVILVGEVSVTCWGEDGAEIPLGILSEGDYFGEISLLTGTAAEATVRANMVTEVLTLGASDFYDLASTHPEIWVEVQEEAERRQRQTAQRVAQEASRVRAAGPLCLI